MKTHEAPEKIYLIRNFSNPTSLNTTNDYHGKFLNEWYKSREKDADVEYTRTDAFIEKACEWLEDHIYEYIIINRTMNEPDYDPKLIMDFKNKLKGE